MRSATNPAAVRVIAYLRCSTNEQADSGLGLAAQRADPCGRMRPSRMERCRVDRRPWLQRENAQASGVDRALGRLAAGEADVLLTKSADRLSRSLKDFCDLTERSQQEGWLVCALDAPADPLTPHGKARCRRCRSSSHSLNATWCPAEPRMPSRRRERRVSVSAESG